MTYCTAPSLQLQKGQTDNFNQKFAITVSIIFTPNINLFARNLNNTEQHAHLCLAQTVNKHSDLLRNCRCNLGRHNNHSKHTSLPVSIPFTLLHVQNAHKPICNVQAIVQVFTYIALNYEVWRSCYITFSTQKLTLYA